MPQGTYSSGLGLTEPLRSGARGLQSRSPRSSICGRGGLPRRLCLSSRNEPFACGQWDCTLKAPPYHAPGYLLLRSEPDGTSTFRCPWPSVSLPSKEYLWARGSAPSALPLLGDRAFRPRAMGLSLKAPPYPAPGYLLLRSGPDGTSTFRCPRPSVSLPSEQYLWATGSAPKNGVIRF